MTQRDLGKSFAGNWLHTLLDLMSAGSQLEENLENFNEKKIKLRSISLSLLALFVVLLHCVLNTLLLNPKWNIFQSLIIYFSSQAGTLQVSKRQQHI